MKKRFQRLCPADNQMSAILWLKLDSMEQIRLLLLYCSLLHCPCLSCWISIAGLVVGILRLLVLRNFNLLPGDIESKAAQEILATMDLSHVILGLVPTGG